MDSSAKVSFPVVDPPSCAVPTLTLAGTRYEIGSQHGAAHRHRIRAFLNDRLARINAVMSEPVTLSSLAPTISAYQRAIEEKLPGMMEELRGLADGAAISVEEALLLQLRRELVGFRTVEASGDCTSFASRQPHAVVLGQTVDLSAHMQQELTLLRIRHAAAGRTVLLVSFTGLLGYLGMNDRGVAICLNLVLGGEWGPGIPGYMAIRHLLDQGTTVDECLELLRGLPLASSRALTLCDRSKLVSVEYIRNEMRVSEGRQFVHTNHFLEEEFVQRDELNPFARTSSLRRLTACRSGMATLAGARPREEYFGLLGSTPIYVAGDGDPRRECTVCAVVMRPDLGQMFVRRGHLAGRQEACMGFDV